MRPWVPSPDLIAKVCKVSFLSYLYICLFVFLDRFLSSFGAYTETRSIDHAGPELTEIHLLLPPEIKGVKGVWHHCPVYRRFLKAEDKEILFLICDNHTHVSILHWETVHFK